MIFRSVASLVLLFAATGAAQARRPQPPPTYPLVVSFISIGTGTSPAAIAQFNLVVAEFEAIWGLTAERTTASWGREGEYDVCFTLANLPPDAADELVDQMWQLDADPMVAVGENVSCGH
jgi:hypothetical protein